MSATSGIMDLATPFYDQGDELTAFCSANVLGKTFVAISGPRQHSNPNDGVTDAITGGNITVAPAGAGAKVIGVAAYDRASQGLVQIYRSPKIVPVTCGAVALTAGQEVQSDANGNAVAWTTGIKAGIAIDNAAVGADAQIALYP